MFGGEIKLAEFVFLLEIEREGVVLGVGVAQGAILEPRNATLFGIFSAVKR